MNKPARNAPLLIVLLALAGLLAACPVQPPTPPQPKLARIEVNPAALLLTKAGDSQVLTAKVFDDQGKEMPATGLTWSSSNPAAVTVGADGKVTAVGNLGSSQISAQVGGVKGSVIAVIAHPVAGAALVADAQIVGNPEPVDASTAFGVGFQYRVTLQGVTPPNPGSVMIGSGEKPVAGKVVAVNGNTVTLEIVPIDEVFANLNVNESYDLSEAPFTTPQAIAQNFETQRLPDGRIKLTQKAGHVLTSQGALSPQAEFGAGPFQCKTEGNLVQIQLAKSELAFSPNLKLDTVWNDTQKKIVVKGQPTVSIEVTPVVNAAINAKVTCKLTFREIQIPLPGPLGIFLGAVIPIGAGFELEGKVPVAQVGVKFKSEVGADFQMGFECNAVSCGKVESLKSILSGNATPVLPTSFQGFKIESSFYAFLFADLEAGARLASLSRFRVSAIESAAGLKLEAKLASEATQVNDTAYASMYKLAFEAVIGAGDEFESFLKMVKVTVAKLELKLTQDIAFSPTATTTADKASFREAEEVRFKVKLDPTKTEFPIIGYNVESVRIYRKSSQQDGSVVPVLVGEANANGKQTEFDLTWVATINGTVKDNFIVFVRTRLLPDSRLELGDVQEGAATGFAGNLAVEWTDFRQVSSPNFESTSTDTLVLRGSVKPVTDAQGLPGLAFMTLDTVRRDFEARSFQRRNSQIQQCIFQLTTTVVESRSVSQADPTRSFVFLETSFNGFKFSPVSLRVAAKITSRRTVTETRTQISGTCSAENLTPQNTNEERTNDVFIGVGGAVDDIQGQITRDASGQENIIVDESKTKDLSSGQETRTINYRIQLNVKR
jgi:hypothetical protein